MAAPTSCSKLLLLARRMAQQIEAAERTAFAAVPGDLGSLSGGGGRELTLEHDLLTFMWTQ